MEKWIGWLTCNGDEKHQLHFAANQNSRYHSSDVRAFSLERARRSQNYSVEHNQWKLSKAQRLVKAHKP